MCAVVSGFGTVQTANHDEELRFSCSKKPSLAVQIRVDKLGSSQAQDHHSGLNIWGGVRWVLRWVSGLVIIKEKEQGFIGLLRCADQPLILEAVFSSAWFCP